jgi:hypothetical protein
MKNIQMKRTLKILGGENEKRHQLSSERKEILTVKEERKIIRNVTNGKEGRKERERENSKCVFNVVTSWWKLSHNAARNKSIY